MRRDEALDLALSYLDQHEKASAMIGARVMAEAAEHAATENEHEPTREALLALASSFRKTEDMIQRRIHP